MRKTLGLRIDGRSFDAEISGMLKSNWNSFTSD
jgi:hypothetical protein